MNVFSFSSGLNSIVFPIIASLKQARHLSNLTYPRLFPLVAKNCRAIG